MQAKRLWSLGQALLLPFAGCFTQPGFRRFVEGLTGLVGTVEEHPLTQSLVAWERAQDWKALEAFAEYGAWDGPARERVLAQQLEPAPGRLWQGDHVWAGDDTKTHRSSKDVWGTCTFHEYTARCPNRATTVRAHNWVVVGALVHNPEQPAWFVPVAGRLYFRKTQLPGPGRTGGPPVPFRTPCELLVTVGRSLAEAVAGKHVLVVDGGYALANVVRPLVRPDDGSPRVDVLTRLRHDARLDAWPPPRQGGRWPGPWRQSQAFLYGRQRQVRWKETCCLWRVAGADVVVKAVVAAVEGYRTRFTLVTTAVTLSGLQVVELFGARFRQEDGFRDLKQRLGWKECRAWTRQPIERATQALFVSLTLLRRLQFALEGAEQEDWWLRPPWNPHKTRPRVLDLERLLRRHRDGLPRLLAAWLDEGTNTVCGALRECVG